MSQIAEVIAKDQALASRTIRLVNSAFYGMCERVTSISHAIVVLGLNTLNNIMIGLSVIRLFKNSKITQFDPEQFWEHCFGTALIAKALSENSDAGEQETVFIAGLLHDMGRLILDQYCHNEFSESLLMAKNESKSLRECERKVMGFDHTETGEWIGRKWSLPEQLIACIRYHHEESAVPDSLARYRDMVHTVAAADHLCMSAGIGFSGENFAGHLKTCPVKGKTTEEINAIIDKTKLEVKATIDEWNKYI